MRKRTPPVGAIWSGTAIGTWTGAGCGYDRGGFAILSDDSVAKDFSTTGRDSGNDVANGCDRDDEELYDQCRPPRRTWIVEGTSPDCEIAEDS